MKVSLTCPFCETEFEGVEYENGKCPNCFETYYFGEECTSDYSDCWVVVEWDKLEREWLAHYRAHEKPR
jgi:hypothetical protein